MTVEEAITKKAKIVALRTKAQTAISNALDAQSYSISGRSVALPDLSQLEKLVSRYDSQISALDNVINGTGSIKVSYGIPK